MNFIPIIGEILETISTLRVKSENMVSRLLVLQQRCQLVMKKKQDIFQIPKKGNLNHTEWVY